MSWPLHAEKCALIDSRSCFSVIDSLQLGDKHRITTPVNWKKGDVSRSGGGVLGETDFDALQDVIVHPGVSNEEAKTLFPEFTQHLVCPCYSRP